MKSITDLSVCIDCAMFIANGEMPEDPNEKKRFATLIDEAIARGEVLNQWVLAGDEDEETFFSWSPCDLCRSRLGGDRMAAAVLYDDEEGAR